MQVSLARVDVVRGALLLTLILNLFFGLASILFPQQLFASFFPAETFSPVIQLLAMELGAMATAWAVAIGLALQDPLGRRSLIQAVLAFMVIFSVVDAFIFFAVPHGMPASNWSSTVLTIILAVLLGVAYPWRDTT